MNKRYTPERITSLAENEIFVFGSNLAGSHGGGAARLAYEHFGAIWGLGTGKVLVKFKHIREDWDELKRMRKEAEKLAKQQ